MSKFSYVVVEQDSKWTAKIVRKQTTKKSVVSIEQDGFASESEAIEWAKSELESFVKKLNDKKRLAKLGIKK